MVTDLWSEDDQEMKYFAFWWNLIRKKLRMSGWVGVGGSHYRTIIPPLEFCNVMSSLGICMHVSMKYFQMRNYFCFETKNLHVFWSLNWASLTRWQYLLLPCICFITLWGPSESGNVHIKYEPTKNEHREQKMNTEEKNEHRERKWTPRTRMNTEDKSEHRGRNWTQKFF